MKGYHRVFGRQIPEFLFHGDEYQDPG